MEASCFPWKGKDTRTGFLYLDAYMKDGDAIIKQQPVRQGTHSISERLPAPYPIGDI